MGFGIPKLYVEFWWPLFLALKFTFLFLNLALKFTFLFLNLAKIQIFIPKSAYGGGTSLGIIPKKKQFFSSSLKIKVRSTYLAGGGAGFAIAGAGVPPENACVQWRQAQNPN